MNMKRLLFFLALVSLTLAGYAAGYEQAVNDLIPKLANPKVEDRYGAQMELQDLASHSSQPGREADSAALGKILAANAADPLIPQPARVWMVRQLEYMGAGEAVAALTSIMNGDDAELRECARRALEKNSAPAASASLRAALEKESDTARKIGLINALGQRADGEAVSLIARHLSNTATAGAAAQALGMIANPAAVDALGAASQNAAINEALIEAANRLLARGDATAAKAVYRKTYAPGNTASARAAALAGLAKADPGGAATLIGEALAGNEPKLQNAAILAAASAGKEVSPTLAALLPKLAPAAKALVMQVLEPSAEKQVIEAAADSDERVRLAAMEALGRMGSAAGVPVLLKVAASDARPDKAVAEGALARISGAGAVAALEQAAASSEAAARAAAINALAARKHATALPAMLKYAGEPDATVQKAALAALRQMGTENEFDTLAKLALQLKSSEAFAALEAIANRVKDKPAAARRLLTLGATDDQALGSLLDVLSVLGGNEALAAVSRLAASSNAEIQQNAVRALGNWPDYAATKTLLDIAANPKTEPTSCILAIQGIVRLVKSAENVPAQTRLDAALAAMGAARRDEEKKLVLSALATVPDAKAAAVLKPMLSDAKFQAEAGLAGVALAELLLSTDKAAAKELAQAVKAAGLSREITRRANSVLNK